MLHYIILIPCPHPISRKSCRHLSGIFSSIIIVYTQLLHYIVEITIDFKDFATVNVGAFIVLFIAVNIILVIFPIFVLVQECSFINTRIHLADRHELLLMQNVSSRPNVLLNSIYRQSNHRNRKAKSGDGFGDAETPETKGANKSFNINNSSRGSGGRLRRRSIGSITGSVSESHSNYESISQHHHQRGDAFSIALSGSCPPSTHSSPLKFNRPKSLSVVLFSLDASDHDVPRYPSRLDSPNTTTDADSTKHDGMVRKRGKSAAELRWMENYNPAAEPPASSTVFRGLQMPQKIEV